MAGLLFGKVQRVRELGLKMVIVPVDVDKRQEEKGSRETASNAALRQNAFIMGVELIHILNTIY